jgi:hypothetical protein
MRSYNCRVCNPGRHTIPFVFIHPLELIMIFRGKKEWWEEKHDWPSFEELIEWLTL